MTSTTTTGKLNMRLSHTGPSKLAAKILGGLALGAFLLAAVALPSGTANAQEPNRPLYNPPAVVETEDDPYSYLTISEFTRVTEKNRVSNAAGGGVLGAPLPVEVSIGVEDDPYAYLTVGEFTRVIKKDKVGPTVQGRVLAIPLPPSMERSFSHEEWQVIMAEIDDDLHGFDSYDANRKTVGSPFSALEQLIIATEMDDDLHGFNSYDANRKTVSRSFSPLEQVLIMAEMDDDLNGLEV